MYLRLNVTCSTTVWGTLSGGLGLISEYKLTVWKVYSMQRSNNIFFYLLTNNVREMNVNLQILFKIIINVKILFQSKVCSGVSQDWLVFVFLQPCKVFLQPNNTVGISNVVSLFSSKWHSLFPPLPHYWWAIILICSYSWKLSGVGVQWLGAAWSTGSGLSYYCQGAFSFQFLHWTEL